MEPRDRREFLKSSAAGSSLLIVDSRTAFGSQANSAPEIGLIGCGSRGTWIVPFFQEYGAQVVALADVFRGNLEATRAKIRSPSARAYVGRDAYQELIASKLDGVVMEVPPYFFPEMVRAAVDAGKPVFLAKPVAVDVPGCKVIAECGRKAEGKTSLWVDFQIRTSDAFQEAARRVHNGALGEIVFGQAAFLGFWQPIREGPGMSKDEYRLRNWYNDLALGGGIIVNRDIHHIDGAQMFLKAHPVRAFGTGGRKVSKYPGDCFDHYLITYWYGNGFKLELASADFLRDYGHIILKIHGSAGTLDTQYNGPVRITGLNAWPGVAKDPTMNRGTSVNARIFLDSIRSGKPVNNAEESVTSTLASMLGQMAAHSGRELTWDEMMKSAHRYELKLAL
jgi:myo-inositol 2-dehydrogenase/D-chiro-inositol 1-dehydrogenase